MSLLSGGSLNRSDVMIDGTAAAAVGHLVAVAQVSGAAASSFGLSSPADAFGLPPSAATGVPLIGYGHSYVSGTGASVTARRFLDRLGGYLGASSVTSRGNSGDSMIQTLAQVINGSGKLWTAGTPGLVVLDSVLNDVLHTTTTRAPQDAIGFTNALRAILRILRTSQYVPSNDPSITYGGTGTWAPNALPASRGGSSQKSSTVGGTATIAGYTPTEITIMAYGFDQYTSVAQTTFDVSVAGTTYGGTQTTLAMSTARDAGGASAVNSNGYQVVSYRVTGLPTGSKSVVVTNRGGGPNNLYIDGYLYPAAPTTAPSIVVVKDAPLVTYTGTPFTRAEGDALIAARNDIVDSVCAETEFGGPSQTRAVSAAEGYDPSTMLAADTWHRNDSGHDTLARVLYQTAKSFPYRLGLKGS